MPVPAAYANYLRRIGMTAPLITRAGEILDFYRGLGVGQTIGIFVSEYVTADGSRQFENLWFFSRRLAMEAHSFLTADNFDVASYFKRLVRVAIEKENYDFRKAVAGSRLSVECTDVADIRYSLRATAENCDSLRDITRRLLVPNLVGTPTVQFP